MTWQPLGLLYIGARLESLGHEVELFDLNVDSLPSDGEFSQLWISATSPQLAEIKRIARETEGWKTKRVLGGACVWSSPDSCRNLGFDFLAGGECDRKETAIDILENARKFPKDTYCCYPVSDTLDWVLPPLRRWAYKYQSYMTDSRGNKHLMQTMFTTRGCPFSCAFCQSGGAGITWGRKVRFEPMWSVEHQIKEIVDSGTDGIAYYDDLLPINRRRMLEILELHKKYGVVFRCFVRSDLIVKHGYEFLKAMVGGGLIEVFIGVESADNRIKDAVGKGTTIEQDTTVLNWCKMLGVRVKCSFILGLPGESRESMEKTRDWIFANLPDRVQCDRLIPMLGTPLVDRPEQYDLTYESRPEEDWYFKGRDNDSQMSSFVSTSHLRREEIDAFWHSLSQELAQAGVPV